MANRFKVLVGTHIEGGRAYKAGEVVVSECNLMKFKGKFQALGAVGSKPAVEEEAPPTAPAPNKPAPAKLPPRKPGKVVKDEFPE